MKAQNALLIIDPQYDFCNPQGALFVPGAVEDMQRLARFITRKGNELAQIFVTIDSHPVNDISHPNFWRDSNGNPPAPFTQITFADVQAGRWIPQFEPEKAAQYLADLEAQGQFPHLIWPEHCLTHSKGSAIDDTLMEALRQWTRGGKQYITIQKGTYPLTEHFGIFQAQIPVADRPETQLNTSLIADLMVYDNVYLAGEAKSHCVATSLKQAMDYAPELAQKMIVLTDCMSDVPGLGHLGEPIYAAAKAKGIRFADSSNA
ncbi:MAG: nicotinamidase [Cytophagales bacterium]|nr:isochorismatase family protein [Bernardetiaceae bacterium]MDW8205376.1 nicotinamidase [Cytophagales bacterium]